MSNKTNPVSPHCQNSLCMPCRIEDEDNDGELCPAEGGEGVAQEDEDLIDKEEEEIKYIKAPRVPIAPSREEVARHRLTHYPFRDWCPHCVKGKGRADPHQPSRQKGQATEVPKIVSDYFS